MKCNRYHACIFRLQEIGYLKIPGLVQKQAKSVESNLWKASQILGPCAIWDIHPKYILMSNLAKPQSGRDRSWITGLAGISGLGPNSEPRGNNRSFPETRERARVLVKKIGSRDSIFDLVNSTYFLKITNHNQHAFNIKYLANLIKKYWTCFRYQKLADFLVCFPPSIRVQVRWPPSWKICLRIQLSFGFWGRAVKIFDNFSRKLAWLLKTIF